MYIVVHVWIIITGLDSRTTQTRSTQRYCILRNRDGKIIYGMVQTSKGDVITVETMLVVRENG